MPTRTKTSVAALVLVLVAGCDAFSESDANVDDGLPPTDRAVFPTGLAVDPTGRHLVVVSSNFDLTYTQGALLLADLDRVRNALFEGSPSENGVILSAFVDAAYTPSFGNRPAFSSDGARLVMPAREDNRVVEIELSSSSPGRLSCGERLGDDVPSCVGPPWVSELPGSDPYAVVITDTSSTRVSGVVGLIGSPEVYLFTIRTDRAGPDRLRVAPLTLGADVVGVRGLAFRQVGNVKTVFAVVERVGASATRPPSSLMWFDPTRADPVSGDASQVVVRAFDLFDTVGASSARDLAVTPDGDALLVLLRSPDGLARLDVSPSGATVTVAHGGSTSTCREPAALAIARVEGVRAGRVDRALVTCFGSDAVVAYDPLTLTETDAVRWKGRGPFDVVVDTSPDHAPSAYVSFFLENTVGVFALVDDEGDPRLVLRGKIGVPSPEGEDGR